MLDFVIYDQDVDRGNELRDTLKSADSLNHRTIHAVSDAQALLDHARASLNDAIYLINVEHDRDALGLNLLSKIWDIRGGYCAICISISENLAQAVLKAHAFDYFTHPYSIQALLESVHELDVLQKKRPLDTILTIYNASKTTFLKQSDIRYFASRGSDITAYCIHSDHTWRCSFLELAGKLNMSRFIRVSRNYVVNTRYIHEIDWAEDLVTLDDGTILPVSRRNRKPLRDLLMIKL